MEIIAHQFCNHLAGYKKSYPHQGLKSTCVSADLSLEMFSRITTKMIELITLHPSHFGCVKSSILTRLKQMYIDCPCPNLGIDIEISRVSVDLAIIDPNEGCCLTRCTFLLQHFQNWRQIGKTHKESFHIF